MARGSKERAGSIEQLSTCFEDGLLTCLDVRTRRNLCLLDRAAGHRDRRAICWGSGLGWERAGQVGQAEQGGQAEQAGQAGRTPVSGGTLEPNVEGDPDLRGDPKPSSSKTGECWSLPSWNSVRLSLRRHRACKRRSGGCRGSQMYPFPPPLQIWAPVGRKCRG